MPQLLESHQDWQEKIRKLRPGRQLIMMRYLEIKAKDQRSIYHVVRILAHDLGYAIDENGSNAFLLQVIREFFAS